MLILSNNFYQAFITNLHYYSTRFISIKMPINVDDRDFYGIAGMCDLGWIADEETMSCFAIVASYILRKARHPGTKTKIFRREDVTTKKIKECYPGYAEHKEDKYEIPACDNDLEAVANKFGCIIFRHSIDPDTYKVWQVSSFGDLDTATFEIHVGFIGETSPNALGHYVVINVYECYKGTMHILKNVGSCNKNFKHYDLSFKYWIDPEQDVLKMIRGEYSPGMCKPMSRKAIRLQAKLLSEIEENDN